MADQSLINGGDTDIAITTEPDNNDSTSQIQKLTQKISLLEEQNQSNKVKINSLEEEIQNHESDKRALSSIAARASELETEVSRLQHDLVSSMSDGQDANAEVCELKRVVEELKAKDIEKNEKVNLLVEKLKEQKDVMSEYETIVMEEIVKKDEEIVKLNEKVEELKFDIDKMSKEKEEVVRKSEKLEGEILTLRTEVEAYEKINIVLKENVAESTNGVVVDGDEKRFGWKVDLAVFSASVCAGALLTLVYFHHAKA